MMDYGLLSRKIKSIHKGVKGLRNCMIFMCYAFVIITVVIVIIMGPVCRCQLIVCGIGCMPLQMFFFFFFTYGDMRHMVWVLRQQ